MKIDLYYFLIVFMKIILSYKIYTKKMNSHPWVDDDDDDDLLNYYCYAFGTRKLKSIIVSILNKLA